MHRILAIALTILPVLPAFGTPAPSDGHPHFSGVWTLDLEASDSLDPLLELQGVSALKRRLMRKTVVTQTIEQSGDTLTIHVDSAHTHATEHLVLDGAPREVTTPEGQTVVQRAFWSDDGQDVIASAEVRLKDGRPATLEVRRHLEPGGTTLVLTVTLRLEDGTQRSARRVFRKKTGGPS